MTVLFNQTSLNEYVLPEHNLLFIFRVSQFFEDICMNPFKNAYIVEEEFSMSRIFMYNLESLFEIAT